MFYDHVNAYNMIVVIYCVRYSRSLHAFVDCLYYMIYYIYISIRSSPLIFLTFLYICPALMQVHRSTQVRSSACKMEAVHVHVRLQVNLDEYDHSCLHRSGAGVFSCYLRRHACQVIKKAKRGLAARSLSAWPKQLLA